MPYTTDQLEKLTPDELLNALELSALGVANGSAAALEYYRQLRTHLKSKMGISNSIPGVLEPLVHVNNRFYQRVARLQQGFLD